MSPYATERFSARVNGSEPRKTVCVLAVRTSRYKKGIFVGPKKRFALYVLCCAPLATIATAFAECRTETLLAMTIQPIDGSKARILQHANEAFRTIGYADLTM